MPAELPAPTQLARVRASRNRKRYQAALDVVELYQRFIARLDRSAIRDAVEHHALVASRDSVLLELQCAFDTIRALRDLGWSSSPTGLLRPPRILRAHKDGCRLDLYYQRAPADLSAGEHYRGVQTAHSFPNPSGLIPDLVLRLQTDGTTRWLLIEVKGGPSAAWPTTLAQPRLTFLHTAAHTLRSSTNRQPLMGLATRGVAASSQPLTLS